MCRSTCGSIILYFVEPVFQVPSVSVEIYRDLAEGVDTPCALRRIVLVVAMSLLAAELERHRATNTCDSLHGPVIEMKDFNNDKTEHERPGPIDLSDTSSAFGPSDSSCYANHMQRKLRRTLTSCCSRPWCLTSGLTKLQPSKLLLLVARRHSLHRGSSVSARLLQSMYVGASDLKSSQLSPASADFQIFLSTDVSFQVSTPISIARFWCVGRI